jgi:hypothetical protein
MEPLVVAAVFVAASFWGAQYWDWSWRAGRKPAFYQEFFEPAVMMACGKGFVVATPPVPTVTSFLFQRTDRFSCSDIPARTTLQSPVAFYQGSWRYLMSTVALAWRVLGLSWSGLGPMVGLFFGATIALAYLIFRLGMRRPLAVFGAVALSVSTLHLLNLPNFRDYSKAPFTLALILILGIMVTARPRAQTWLICGALYGAVLGIGYGFRSDFLVNIPVFFIVVFGFTANGIRRNLAAKSAASALCLGTFLFAAWPIVNAVYTAGGCQWHTALLGLTTTFVDRLGLQSAPYDFGHAYNDWYVYQTTTSYARRVDPQMVRPTYCSHQYDVITGRYFFEIVRTFPADMLTRAYASALRIVNLPFNWSDAPLPDLATRFYEGRFAVLSSLKGTGLAWVAAAILFVAAANGRRACFLLFLVLYFGGYPAVQFVERHYFHLEFITWWAMGFVVEQALTAIVARVRSPGIVRPVPNWRQAGWLTTLLIGAVVSPLLVLRVYQHFTTRALFERYLDAPSESVAIDGTVPGIQAIPLSTSADRESGEEFIDVTLNTSRCGPHPSVTFRYDKAFVLEDFTRTFTIGEVSDVAEPTHIFSPVYKHFLGVEFSDPRPGCAGTIARIRDRTGLTLLLPAVLPPRWRQFPLYQRLREIRSENEESTSNP